MLKWSNRPQMVTQTSTNWAWHRITSFIKTNTLPLSHTGW